MRNWRRVNLGSEGKGCREREIRWGFGLGLRKEGKLMGTNEEELVKNGF